MRPPLLREFILLKRIVKNLNTRFQFDCIYLPNYKVLKHTSSAREMEYHQYHQEQLVAQSRSETEIETGSRALVFSTPSYLKQQNNGKRTVCFLYHWSWPGNLVSHRGT